MTRMWMLVSVALGTALAQGQSALPASTSCVKNVSFAIAEDGQPVPAIPKFASKWLGNKPHLVNLAGLCFSQIPSSTLPNYVVIFSGSETTLEGLAPTAHTYTSAKATVINGAALSSLGGTWNYSYTGTPPARSTYTLDLQRADKPKSLYVRAYNQQGGLISHYSLGSLHPKEKLLEQALADIFREAPTARQQKPFAAPLSVYYVNCDVDGPPSSEMDVKLPSDKAPSEPAPQKTSPPQTALDFWSNPAGAEIYLDGAYIGKTPYFQTVSPGEHSISIRKKDFGMWQRKISLSAGTRRIAAYLEQKTLSLQ